MSIFSLRAKRKIPLRHRLALYLPLAALVLGLLAATWFSDRRAPLLDDAKWTDIDFATLPEVDLLRRYLRIDTSETTGNEIRGAEFLAAELERIGLTPTIETFGDKHANVWAILEGESPEALVLHNHIDVSPAGDPEAWDFPPFGAQIDQAWLYGRGVFDMKSLAIVQLLALERIIESGHKPAKSIIFLATGSEEVGSELGSRWILEQNPQLAERFWVALTEGGVVEPLNRWVIKYWGIEFAQKHFAKGYVCSDDRQELEELLLQIRIWQEDVEQLRVTPEYKIFGPPYGPTRVDTRYQAVLLEPERVVLDEPAFRQTPEYLQALLRDELVLFDIEPAPSGGYQAKLFFHLLPGDSLDETRQRLLPDWLLAGVGYSQHAPLGAAHGSPVDHPAFQAMVEAVLEMYPDAPTGPYFLPWSATDSRFFRQHGIPAYGFSPFVIFSTETFRVDGLNERLSLPGYMSGFELYHDAVLRIAG